LLVDQLLIICGTDVAVEVEQSFIRNLGQPRLPVFLKVSNPNQA
jgi:hypothetical protein